jgi:TolA-binding protein
VVKLSTQVSDMSAALKSAEASKPDASTQAANQAPSATDLFASAQQDRLGGKLDLALQEYTMYVSQFASTPQAPEAQYYIGSIDYSNQQWDDSVKAFGVLVQSYPTSDRVPDALYYKADSLARLGRMPEAMDTLKDLRKRFPDNPIAKRSLTVKSPPRF